MLTFKRLNEISLDEAVRIWNLGFEGYFTDAAMNVQSFTNRLVTDDLSVGLSFVAYADDEPVGIVLNGVRENVGKKIAWNGGTGVAAKFRGQGIGKQLMQHAFDLYKQEDIELATLEALSQNEQAIKMYNRVGYQEVERLVFLKQDGKLPWELTNDGQQIFQIIKGLAVDAQHVSILQNHVPWQTQWQSVRKDGELLIVSMEEVPLAYFLFKRGYRPDGTLGSIVLYQAGMDLGKSDVEDAIYYGLKEVFQPDVDCTRMTFNFPQRNEAVIDTLKNAGFEVVLEQVAMEKKM